MSSDPTPDETPLHWPEDDSAPPPEPYAFGVGEPPPGAGVATPELEHNLGVSGADTVTGNRTDEDFDNER
jgi:hypothetical protein